MKRLIAVVGVVMFGLSLHAEVRPPAVAGSFYPGSAAELEKDVRSYLGKAPAGREAPTAVVAPHAGYVFSGPTAGKAFAALSGAKVSRVILLGPSHHASFSGGALPDPSFKAFATPLGDMPLDTEALNALRKFEDFSGPARAHGPEHCLEVELPFLQVTVGKVPVVPILVGSTTERAQARVMAKRLAELITPGTVVVVSTDFTHHGRSYGYAPFAREANIVGALTDLGRITGERAAAIDPRGFWAQVDVADDTVCGARPVLVLLELLAHAFSGSGTLTDVTTSAAVSRTTDQVVTYVGIDYVGTWSPWRESGQPPRLETLSPTEQKAALALARATLETHLGHGGELAAWFASNRVEGNLAALAGVFVTVNNTGEKLVREGKLRGCIGSLEAREPLVDSITHAAVSAAHDPRFPALERSELGRVALEISVLSPMRPVPSPEEIELGTHGVLLGKGGRHAVFLPQVATETGWDRATFLSQLSLKAGLPRDAWKSGATFEIFTAQVFHEAEQ